MQIRFTILFICLISFSLSEEIDLNDYERTFYSSNGEDGILSKLHLLIKPKSKFFLKIQANNEIGGHIYFLLLQDWKCIVFNRSKSNPKHGLYKEYVTTKNLNDLLKRYSVPSTFDLLCIDIKYNDFHLWNALDDQYQPAIVVIKYNATLPADEDKVVKYYPYFCGDQTNYFGASILALYKLGRTKGYSLVYADKSGTSLFFVKDSILEEKNLSFKNRNDVEKIYRPLRVDGYDRDTKNRPYIVSEELISHE